MHGIQQLYASLANRAEMTREVVWQLSQHAQYRFVIAGSGRCNTARICNRGAAAEALGRDGGRLLAPGGGWYSLQQLQEYRSRALLMRSRLVEGRGLLGGGRGAGGDGRGAGGGRLTVEVLDGFVEEVELVGRVVGLLDELAQNGNFR